MFKASEIKVGDIVCYNGKYTYLVFDKRESYVSLYTINNRTHPDYAGVIINDYKLILFFGCEEWEKVE